MNCFFGTSELPQENHYGKSAVVMFHIPDVGIRFKAPFDAVNRDHSDFASLLALLEFIDSNQKYFANKPVQIFGTNQTVINQVNGRDPVPKLYEPLLDKAAAYRAKYQFVLDWIPTERNSAYGSLLD